LTSRWVRLLQPQSFIRLRWCPIPLPAWWSRCRGRAVAPVLVEWMELSSCRKRSFLCRLPSRDSLCLGFRARCNGFAFLDFLALFFDFRIDFGDFFFRFFFLRLEVPPGPPGGWSGPPPRAPGVPVDVLESDSCRLRSRSGTRSGSGSWSGTASSSGSGIGSGSGSLGSGLGSGSGSCSGSGSGSGFSSCSESLFLSLRACRLLARFLSVFMAMVMSTRRSVTASLCPLWVPWWAHRSLKTSW
jgi:hypothetical protein